MVRHCRSFFAVICCITFHAACQAERPEMTQLLQEIQDMTTWSSDLTKVESIDPKVMNALAKVDRASFVSDDLEHVAYRNEPLPIGHGQTVSQPFIVALMTHLLEPAESHRILEIGTGSGYQAAILAELCKEVYTIEIVPELAATATQRLEDLGYDNIHVKVGDGWFGWVEYAPFNSIIVTAQAPSIPGKLVDQLADNGVMVLPIGTEHGIQELIVVRKIDGVLQKPEWRLHVRFVPMTGEAQLIGELGSEKN